MPNVVIIAGANGAGKSTAAPYLLRDTLGVDEFVNADQIAAGLSGFNPQGAAFEAGRIMLRRIHALSSERQDFAFETTLASRSFAPLIQRLRQASNYRCYLIYLWLDSPALARARVATRVAAGGHDVPWDVIQRRYRRGIENLKTLYRPLADNWRIYDNSRDHSPRLVATGLRGRTTSIVDPIIWSRIKEMKK